MKLAEQIRTNRKNAGLTQEQVANYLGVSTPAVNKWEKGSTYPDIVLLPALARLLKIDMNELFSFCEELSDIEIEQAVCDISRIALEQDVKTAFEMAAGKIKEYPHCEQLIYKLAVVLNAALTMEELPAEQKMEYELLIISWLEQIINSENEQVKFSAIYILSAKYIQMEKDEEAERLLERLPDISVDTTVMKTKLLERRQDAMDAAVFLEGRIMQAATNMQGYLYQLIELEGKAGNYQEAEEIAEITDEMTAILGLWDYGKGIPHLLIALYQKDRERSLERINKILEEIKKPSHIEASPLYRRYAEAQSDKSFIYADVGEKFLQKFISEIKTMSEYEFIRDEEAIKHLLQEDE